MPTYMGQTVDQGFLDYIVATYKGGYVAMHPAHVPPVESDATLITTMESASVRGGPDADLLARQPFFLNPSATVSYRNLILADDASAYFPLQETSGTSAGNAVSGGPNGTISGGVTLGAAGPISGGRAMTFNGTTGKITVPNGSASYANFGTGPLTLECWLRLTAALAATASAVDLKNNGTLDAGPQVNLDASGGLYFPVYNGTSGGTAAAMGMTAGQWYHVVGVLTRGPDTLTLYRNGVAVGTGAFPGGSATPPVGDVFTLGCAGTTTWFLPGSLAHVAVYKVALTPAQIVAHYNARNPRTVQ